MKKTTNQFPPHIKLALLPTPIRPLRRISELCPDTSLFIKRDDLTGCELSGNKARKLEFLIADALEKESTVLITCGGIQSNHARATAITAAGFGMKSHLLLRGEKPDHSEANMMLDLLVGAKIEFLTGEEYFQAPRLMEELAQELARQGERPYIIPEGGSCALGSLGYALAMSEIIDQNKAVDFDYIVCAVGSAGTLAGLIMGSQLFGFAGKIIGINICADAPYFKKRTVKIIREASEKFGLLVSEEGNWDIIDGYPGLGYARTQPQELEIIRLMAQKEGIILDPVYTGKAFYGMMEEIKKGTFGEYKKILFLHTGGIFGLLTSNYSTALFG